MTDLDPFAVHDLGCRCWPHVSESALSEATIAGAVAEYRESKREIATLRATLDGLVFALDFHNKKPSGKVRVCRSTCVACAALAMAKEAP